MFKRIGDDDELSEQFVDTWAEENDAPEQASQTPVTASSLRSILRGERPTHESVTQADQSSLLPEQLHSEYTVIQVPETNGEIVQTGPSRFRFRFRK